VATKLLTLWDEPFSKGFRYVLRRFSYDEQLHKVDEGILTVSFDLTTLVR